MREPEGKKENLRKELLLLSLEELNDSRDSEAVEQERRSLKKKQDEIFQIHSTLKDEELRAEFTAAGEANAQRLKALEEKSRQYADRYVERMSRRAKLEKELALLDQRAPSGQREQILVEMKKYRQVRNPDYAEVAFLLKLCLGEARSMRQFAREMNYDAAYTSRGIKYGMVSDEFIAAALENSAAECGVSVQQFMEALGREYCDPQLAFYEKGRETILKALRFRGYSAEEGESFDIPLFGRSVMTDAAGGNGVWKFIYKDEKYARTNRSYLYDSEETVMRVFGAFYCGAAEADRISVCVNSRELFEVYRSILKRYVIRDRFSVILLSGNDAAEEYEVPTTGDEATVFGSGREKDEKN